MASEIPYSAQIAGIARIMCRERFLCFLNHLRKTDRCSKVLVSKLRPIPRKAGGSRQARRFAFAPCRVRREAAQQQPSRPARAHFSKTHVLMLPPKALKLECRPRRLSSCTTARLQREEYRLRLKRIPPIRQGGRFPPFKSSTPACGALALSPLCAVVKRQRTFPFWKEKLCFAHFFSPKRNPMIPGEKGRKKTTWLSRNGDSHYRQKQCSI